MEDPKEIPPDNQLTYGELYKIRDMFDQEEQPLTNEELKRVRLILDRFSYLGEPAPDPRPSMNTPNHQIGANDE